MYKSTQTGEHPVASDAHCFVVWLIQIQASGRLVLRVYKIKPCGKRTIKNSMGLNGMVIQRLRMVAKQCYLNSVTLQTQRSNVLN